MDDEKLIEFVRKHEFIYNFKHPKYVNTVKKDIVWKEIADQLKQPAAACKQRWQCLRDTYRKALDKRKEKGEEAAKNVKQWKYEKEMAFVVPFIMKRSEDFEKISDDEESDTDDESYTSDSNVSEKSNTDKTAAVDVSFSNSTISSGILCDIKNNIVQNNKPKQNQPNKKAKAVKRKAIELDQSESVILMKTFLAKQSKFEPPRGQDELERFFVHIYDTVKKFSPYQQALAKNKIFSAVSEMELQQLAPSN